jgi:hypothetical protein
VAVLLVLFVIFAPQESDDAGAAYSSYATGAGGSRALYETLSRLGFAVSRNDRSLIAAAPDTASTYVLLQPGQPLTTIEQATLLASIRHGAILVFTPGDQDLADSLGFQPVPAGGFFTLNQTTVAGGNPPARDSTDPRSAFQAAFPIASTVAATAGMKDEAFLWLTPAKDDDTARAQLDSTRQPTLVLGHRVQHGYAIAVAPAPIVMNQLLRDPRVAIAIVRAIDFANAELGHENESRSNRVVFDEYHHGFGTHADMAAAIEHALTATTVGRMVLGLIAAALVLLLAFAVRPIAPLSAPPASRRSPLEHVGALAQAYSQVNARALGASRLVRGLRRRHPLGLARSVPDPVYLSALRTRMPAVSADIERVSTALAADSSASSASSDHFATIGGAVANIERAFRE